MTNYVKIFLFLILHSLIVFVISNNVKAQTNPINEDAMHVAEDLWSSIDLITMRKNILDSTKISVSDLDLFMKFINVKYDLDEFYFFQKVASGEVTVYTMPNYVQNLTHKYILAYPDFLKVKTQFALQQNSIGNKTLAANGPCVNTDFADSTTNGWREYLAKACSTSAVPCTQVLQPAGFTSPRISIVSAGTFDPYIPTLSRVAPGKKYAVQLEDYLNGGNASVISQTFMVTPTNNVFTYHYAVVLEEPGGTGNQVHAQAERPYFKVRMQDDLGNEIICADYTVWAEAPYTNFVHSPTPNPYPGVNGGPAIMDLWYRDWTTVSIPLLGYVGRNVTIEFMASDCSRGGHRGYAYIDAECSFLSPIIPPLVCGTSENFTIQGPANFAQYKWSGPGIIGSSTADSVVLNKAGNYSVLLTPISANNPCPITVNFIVPERCFPPAFKTSLCETVVGSGKAAGVNLANYNTLVTSYHALATVKSWHSGLPATNANLITVPSNLTVTSSSKYYAAIGYTTPGGDTVELDFTVNPLPNIKMPAIGPFCLNAPSYKIAATPTGGTFSGQNVSSTGVFTPSVAGTFPIKYKVVNATGCKDSATITIVVNAPPTVNAGPDQKLCSTVSTIQLNSIVQYDSIIKWSGGSGTFSSVSTINPVYTPTASEISGGSVTLTLTVLGKMPCSPVSDQVVIYFTPSPTVNAGPDQKLCATTTTVQLNGSVTNDSIIKWTGGKGSFSSVSVAGPVYTPTAAEIVADSVVLTLTVIGKAPCGIVSDKVVIHFTPAPTVNAGPDQKLCSIVSTVLLSGTVKNDSIIKWSGGSGTFSTTSKASSVYTPTATEIAGGSVTLTLTVIGKMPCSPVSDQIVILFTPAPTVNAGLDQLLCSTNPIVNLNGTVQHDSIVKWTGGTGSFSSASTASSVYTPTAAEIKAGSVTLTLTVIGKSPCNQVSDKVIINFTLSPTVNAGPDQKLCSTSSTVNLNGTVQNDSIIKWTGGAGTFSSTSTAISVYTPTAAEIAAGSVTLTLTVMGKKPCSTVSDQVIIYFTPAPTVHAGPDQKLCSTVTTVQLGGSVQNDSLLKWSGGNGTFSSISLTNPIYTPTAAEITADSVILTVTAIAKSPCMQVTDQVLIRFTPAPVVNAGPDQRVCSISDTVNLNATVQHDSIIKWSGGSGIFSSPTTAKSVYTPTTAEVTAGSAALTISVTGKSPCSPVSDQLIILFTPAPIVNAGPDQNLCNTVASVQLNGAVQNDSTLIWTGGAGTFSSASITNPVYTPTVSEKLSGTVILTATATGNFHCGIVSDQVVLHFFPSPPVNVGPDQTVCKGAVLNFTSNTLSSYNFIWKDEQGTVLSTQPTLSVIVKTDSVIVLTVTDSLGCFSKDTVSITAVIIPVFNLGGPYCISDSLLLNAAISNIPTGNVTPYWKRNGVVISKANTYTLKITNDGVYGVFYVDGSCSASDSVQVFKNPVLNPLTDIVECVGKNTNISVNQINGGVYSWTNNGTSIPVTGNAINVNVLSGVQLISVVVTDPNNCQANDSVSVSGIPIPVVSINDTSVCIGQSVTINGTPVNFNAIKAYNPIYSWSKNHILLNNKSSGLQINTPGLYTLSVSAGNCTGTDSMNFTLNPLPVVGLSGWVKYCPDTIPSVLLTAGAAPSSIWQPGGETPQSILVSYPGDYSVTITNQFNCSASGKTEVREICPPRLFVGNAFSPNKDGINDLFNVYGVHIGKYRLLIFNRWGEIIYESTDIHVSWDGYYKGELMPIGVYPWIITYEGDTPEYLGPYQLQGSVTVVK